MRAITQALKVPLHRFLRPPPPENPAIVFYRSMATATKFARVRAERRYGWLREIIAYLRRFVEFPATRLPIFKVPDDPRRLTNQDIEQYATETRRFWNLGDGPISNVLWLIENNGAIVARYELGANTLDAFSQWRESDPAPSIVLGSDKRAAARSRVDMVHELGHVLFHRGIRRAFITNPALFKMVEEQAFRFAGAFLLPEAAFAEDFAEADLDALRLLKAKWKVSLAVMIRRSRQIGLISPKQERRLWINLARRGWRTKEPLDDELEAEEPRLLRRSFNLLVDSSLVERHEIPYQLALAPVDIEELAGLPSGYFEAKPPPAKLLKVSLSETTEKSDDPHGTLPFPAE
jgi:Zn-dependent peptidase ImmA (M78 family)